MVIIAWVSANLPSDPEIYGNPQEAGQLLQSLGTLQEAGALRGAVIRLHQLLPYRKSGAAGTNKQSGQPAGTGHILPVSKACSRLARRFGSWGW